ncbi:MAG: hypothetical protein ACKO23_18630, partial [Gemmataceae bacterium]
TNSGAALMRSSLKAISHGVSAWSKNRLPAMVIACLAACVLVLPVKAGGLSNYTGHSRIGHGPEDKQKQKDDKILGVAGEEATVGATIYFMVFDRLDSKNKAEKGDVFGTGLKNFDENFVVGKKSDRKGLDTSARYLYLYQVVNDSGRSAGVKTISVRLIIDPQLITSWGHFANRVKGEGKSSATKGVGFTASLEDEPDKGIRPVSTAHSPNKDRTYQNPAPPVTAARPYGLSNISIGNRNVASDEDGGKEPETVMLVNDAVFPDNAYSTTPASRLLAEESSYRGNRDSFRIEEEDRKSAAKKARQEKRWPAFRVIWNEDEPIRTRERSTMVGFTSDYPPTYEPVTLTSRGMGVRFGSGQIDGEQLPDPKSDADKKTTPAIDGLKKDNPSSGIKSGRLPISGEDGIVFVAAQLPGAGGGALPTVSGTVPTPVPPVSPTSTGSAAASPGELPYTGGGSGTGSGGVGQPVGGASSGGGMGPVAPGSAMMAGRGSGGGGGGIPGGGGGLIGGGGNQNQTKKTNGQDQQSQEEQNQDQNNSGTTTVVNNIQPQIINNITNNNSNTNTNTNGGCCCDPNGNVVPAPPAWLLGILGLPVFYFLKRRRDNNNPTLEIPAAN